MVGFIVKNQTFGRGRIVEELPGSVRIAFFDTGETLSLTMCHRYLLPLGSRCITARGTCHIKGRKVGLKEAHYYEVQFDNGDLDEISETDVVSVDPVDLVAGESSPLALLQNLQPDGLTSFVCRETLVAAYHQTVRGGLGMRALLSSRIDLRAHQAYVAGVVLLDRQQRYLLADEVGLGKTIEAGIIIHDLLIRKPEARILVIAPGALTQQWLAELYGKFCGRWFRLPEWSGALPSKWQQTIFSFTGAIREQQHILAIPWDLVVIDEAHHLLASPDLYQIAQTLSAASDGVLLLSALPAQHREEEYLRLLAILEPGRYRAEPGDVENFRTLFDQQRQLGTFLNWIGRHVGEVATGTRSAQSVIDRIQAMAKWPVLAKDEKLQLLAARLDGANPVFADEVHNLLHHVGDTHRIHRRILRNRRARLVEQAEILAVERKLHRIAYPADPLESNVHGFAERLLRSLRDAGLESKILWPLARLIFQSAADPGCLTDFLALARKVVDAALDEPLPPAGLYGYDEWPRYSAALWTAARPFLDRELLADTQRAARLWLDDDEHTPRFTHLLDFLKAKHRAGKNEKFVVFAGFPGLAQALWTKLSAHIPARECARFFHGMAADDKEKEARWFQRDPAHWLLVTDETGGEGRNFQFAAELVHYDLPWSAARVEQRIGRLDRLGRERGDVVSNVVCCADSNEDALLRCFERGFEVFTRSISGLEFALRELEREIVGAAVGEGTSGLAALPESLRISVEAERARDEGAEVLDEASNERQIAEIYRSAQSTPEREHVLENAFAAYFKHIADNRSVRFCKEADYPEGIVLFHSDDIHKAKLGLLLPETGNSVAPVRGTFLRSIAQQRPDLEFFSIGNTLFDAVCRSLFESPHARTYAIERTYGNAASPPWRGFEFVFRVSGARALAGGKPGLLNQLDRIFAQRTTRLWVNEKCELAQRQEAFLPLRTNLRREDKDVSWWNLTKDKAACLEHFYRERDWSSLVEDAANFARESARTRFAAVLADPLDAEERRLAEQERQLRALRPVGWQEELDDIAQLRRCIATWEVELDTVGFFSANGGVRQSR